MFGVRPHMADIHPFIAQHLLQKGTEAVLPHPPDKGAVATEPGDAHRHVSRRAAGAFEITVGIFRHQVDHGVTQYPYAIYHA